MASVAAMATKAKERYEGLESRTGEKPSLVSRQLPARIKQRIAVLFGQFHGLAEVRDIILAEFGVEINKGTLSHYDPERGTGKPSKRLVALYNVARERHLNDLTTIGVAHQTHRLRVIDRMVYKAEKKEQFTVAASLLKQAAEEMGGLLTNKRQVTHFHISPEDARQELAHRLAGFIEARPGEEGDTTTQPTDIP